MSDTLTEFTGALRTRKLKDDDKEEEEDDNKLFPNAGNYGTIMVLFEGGSSGTRKYIWHVKSL